MKLSMLRSKNNFATIVSGQLVLKRKSFWKALLPLAVSELLAELYYNSLSGQLVLKKSFWTAQLLLSDFNGGSVV